MLIEFYNFSKRENSTKQVSPNDPSKLTISNAYLKDSTSFQNPTIILKEKPNNVVFSPSAYNYCSIPYWQRYYFVTDWRWENGVWEVDLKVDVLASFKTAIGSTSAYIIRSASQYNGDILDTFYPTTTVTAITKQQVSSEIFHTTIPGGCFILGCINNSNSVNRVGSVTYYVLTSTQLTGVLVYMFGSGIYQSSGVNEISEGLYKSMFDPFQYIVSCMWFPYPASAVGEAETDTVKVGYWDTGVSALRLKKIIAEIGFKTGIPIARHPQIARGAYLDHAPYTKLTLFYPPFGEIPIDTSFMIFGNNNYLYGMIYLDFITGIANCYVTITDGYDTDTTADPYRFMTMRTSQIGVPIQISQVLSDYSASLQSVGNAVGNAFTWNFSGVFKDIMASYAADMPKVSSLGANGSFIEIIEPPYLIIEHKQVVDENLTEFGRPLCNTRTISQLSGYIQCGEADHAIGGTDGERKEINKYLKEGFFYE